MKRVLGYTNPWSVVPGETVAVHVHTIAPEPYTLDVVRVVSGDAEGLGLDLRPQPSSIDGRYDGQPQQTALGSALIIDLAPTLVPGQSFGLSLWVWPTMPRSGRQGLADGGSYRLEIGDGGTIVFTFGEVSVRGGAPLVARRWTHIVASFDADRGEITVRQSVAGDGIASAALVLDTAAATKGLAAPAAERPLVIAALGDAVAPHAHFNGKIARPQVSINGRPAARWPFEPFDKGQMVGDLVGAYPGRLVNLPTRAVTGPDWSGDVHDWRAAPAEYDAIHFHEDDLYDAAWDVAHRLTIPDDWKSGYYAVRLRAGDDTSYLPLFVRPPPDRPAAPLAFIASTLTTIAYANYHFHLRVDMNEASLGRVTMLSSEDVLLCGASELGLSTYDLHRDGSPVRHASRLRPIVNNWPGGEVWNLNADTHILAWLDRIGQPYDVITDEDLHREGAALFGRYRAVMTGSHPEYWTTPMWDGLSHYLGGGGRLLYFGGNGFYWRTAMSDAWPGAIEVRRAEGGGRYTAEVAGHYHSAFTGELGGLWARSGRTPNMLVGVGTRGIGFDGIGRFRRTEASRDARVAWLFEGVADDVFGERGLTGCAAASEIDATDDALGTPAHALIVAASEGHTDAMQPMPENILMPHPAMSARHDASIRAELTFFETAGGGAVLSCSSLSWAGAIAVDDFGSDVARISANALRRFLDPLPFPPPWES